MMKNGKKLTRFQRNVLLKNGITNAEKYLYLQMRTESEDGSKSLNQKSSKVQMMEFLNVDTNLTECYKA